MASASIAPAPAAATAAAPTPAPPRTAPADGTTPAAGSAPAAASTVTLRQQQNVAILRASMEVSIQSGNDSMQLLYRAAIDRINGLLEPTLGPDAIAAASSQDNSPEGTAGRILAQSTAFFDAYAAQHKNKDPETVLRDFVSLVRGGFEKGYGEAFDILSGLGVMGDDSPIQAGVQQTFALVQKGYDDFLNSRLAALKGDGAADAPASGKASNTQPV